MKKYFLQVLAHDKMGLISNIAQIINRRLITIISLSAFRTDILENVVLVIEIECETEKITSLQRKLENIVEVFKCLIEFSEKAAYSKVGTYFIEKQAFNSTLHLELQTYGGNISSIDEDFVVLQKVGSDSSINTLYNKLEGEHLKYFTLSPPICMKGLNEGEQSSDIRTAA